MRFTRAAKVAAFPLLAMVLVVALIACQGPVGDAGKDGGKGDTGAGTPGKDATPGLDAKALDAVVLNINTTAAVMAMVDVSAGFTGGTAEGRTYRIVSATNVWTGLAYSLDGSTLKVSAPGVEVNDDEEDAVIWIEATDTDGANEVAHVNVRANDEVSMTGVSTLTVGTQAAESRKLADAEKADYHDSETIECAMKNTCEVTLTAVDDNIRDVLDWMVYVTATTEAADIADANNDVVSASVTNGAVRLAGVVTITGLKSGTAIVRVWAVDEGKVPLNMADNDNEDDGDQSRPWPTSVHTITVTVDAAPTLSEDAIEAVTMDIVDTAEIVGTVFNLGTPVEEMQDPVVTPAYPSAQTIVEVTLLLAANEVPGRTLQVIGRNSGTVSITVKLSEVADTDHDQPDQYVEHTFTATVKQS